MDSVHCQRCSHWPAFHREHRRRYFVTSCMHIVCESCVKDCTDRCPNCQRSCRMLEMNSQTSGDARALFSDPVPAMKEALQAQQKAIKIVEFQLQLYKDGIRSIGRLADLLTAIRSENNAMKAENNRLRAENNSLKQKNDEARRKLVEMQKTYDELKMGLSAENGFSKSPVNFLGRQSPSGLLHMFRDAAERPNAHVQPIMVQNQSSTPFSTARNSGAESFSSLNQSQTPFEAIGFPGVHSHGVARSAVASSPGSANFATPGSQITEASESPFFRSPNRISGSTFSSSSITNLNESQSQSPSARRTPELIHRLRYLKCSSASTPSGNQSPRF